MDRAALFESVPNFSEGRRHESIKAIAAAADQAYLLDTDADPNHNRAVVSLAGARGRLLEGVLGAIGKAVERIDLPHQQGRAPRLGTADGGPGVPLGLT